MHKLRNTKHRKILERVLDIIPPGFKEPIFKQMKRKTRQFCALYGWDETRIRKMIEDDTWGYCWPFFNE
jgi:hypothetical protein